MAKPNTFQQPTTFQQPSSSQQPQPSSFPQQYPDAVQQQYPPEQQQYPVSQGGFNLKNWLKGLEMGPYENLFREHGLDNPQALQALTDSQLMAMGFKQASMRNQIMSALQQQHPSTAPSFASGFNMRTWLGSLDLVQYEPYFTSRGLTSKDHVLNLDDFTLKEMGLDRIGVRNRVMSSVRELQQHQMQDVDVPLTTMHQGPGYTVQQQRPQDMQPQVQDMQPQSQNMLPEMIEPSMPSMPTGQSGRFPSEWLDVAERLNRFFPSLPFDTIRSSVMAAKGEGQTAVALIRQSTGLEPQEYVEVVEEYDMDASQQQPRAQLQQQQQPQGQPGARAQLQQPQQRQQLQAAPQTQQTQRLPAGSVYMPMQGSQSGFGIPGVGAMPQMLRARDSSGTGRPNINLPQIQFPDGLNHPGAFPFPNARGGRPLQ